MKISKFSSKALTCEELFLLCCFEFDNLVLREELFERLLRYCSILPLGGALCSLRHQLHLQIVNHQSVFLFAV